MFEQLRVLGQGGAHAVVAGRLDEAASDEFGPDTVGHHACGQRVGFAGDGIGHVEAAAAFGELLDLAVGEHGGELTGDDLARTRGSAAEEDDALDSLGFVEKHHRMGRALRAGRLEADDLDLEVVAGVTVGDVVGADQ